MESTTTQDWNARLILVVVLYLMYSTTFLLDYLMNDELLHIGRAPLAELPQRISQTFLLFGRALFGLYHSLVYEFAGYDPFRIQVVRFLNFASLTGIGLFLLRFLRLRSTNHLFGLAVVLAFYSLPPVRSMMGYSLQLISNSQPSMWLSLLAFSLYFSEFTSSRLSTLRRGIIVFFILMLAMLSTQTFALFSLVPLSYLALTEWTTRKKRIIEYLGLSAGALFFSGITFLLFLKYSHSLGTISYKLAEQSVATMTSNPTDVLLVAFNPFSYWSAFSFWSFPFPFHFTEPFPDLKPIIASTSMLAWLFLLVAAIRIELHDSGPEQRRQIGFKWLSVLGCVALGAFFVMADAPGRVIAHRPHIYLTLMGIVIFSGAYSLQVLASRYSFMSGKMANAAMLILIAFSCAGAQSDVLRGITFNKAEQMSYIRTELMKKNPDEIKRVVVIIPDKIGCAFEPCDPWFGRVTSSKYHLKRKRGYRYALATLGVSPDAVEIVFRSDAQNVISKGDLLIDWTRYLAARMR